LRIGLPGPRRQPALIVLGIALMLITAAVAGALYLRVGNREPVLVMARSVPVGQAIADRDLAEVNVAADPSVKTIPAAQRAQVVGQVAAAALPEGALLTRAQLSAQAVPAPGQAKVGVVLQPGQLPAEGLDPGDRVMVVAARAASGAAAAGAPPPGTILVREARVFEQRRSETSDATVVTLIVWQADAPNVVRYGAAGQVGLAVLPASAAGDAAPDSGDKPAP
jgi:hypothetical protein